MAWNTPISWTANMVVTNTHLNEQVRDNTTYLFNGRPMENAVSAASAQYYSTTNTAFTDIAISASANVSNGRLLVWGNIAAGAAGGNAGDVARRLAVNTTGAGHATYGLHGSFGIAPGSMMAWVFTGLPTGWAVATIQHRRINSPATALIYTHPVYIGCLEV